MGYTDGDDRTREDRESRAEGISADSYQFHTNKITTACRKLINKALGPIFKGLSSKGGPQSVAARFPLPLPLPRTWQRGVLLFRVHPRRRTEQAPTIKGGGCGRQGSMSGLAGRLGVGGPFPCWVSAVWGR